MAGMSQPFHNSMSKPCQRHTRLLRCCIICFAGACPSDAEVVAVLWLACHDPFQDNAEAASDLWEYSGATLEADFAAPLVRYLGHRNADVRQAAADALAAGLEVSIMNLQ